MPNYVPTPAPFDVKQLSEYILRELRRVGDNLRDNADQIHYRTVVSDESLSAATSANWKCSDSDVLRLSTSNTMTFTGIAHREAWRERVLVNVGTGVAVLKSEAAESSASNRFLLPAATWELSANAVAMIWYDAISSRHRGFVRT